MLIRKLIFLVPVFLFTSVLYSQQQSPNFKTYIAKISYHDTLININDRNVMQFSDILTLQDKILTPNSDYIFNYKEGLITLSKDLYQKYELDTFQIYNLNIDYDVFPYSFKDEYSSFEILSEIDTLTGDTIQVATQKKDFIGSIFEGTDLQKSGSLFRGVNIGSNRDLSINSGFRLQLNGKLTDDIEINAALTDESSPIQPEGNTEKLQELDKVFIEIKSNNIVGTIGDINVDFENLEFLSFKRKIQGAKGFADYGAGSVFLSGAVQRGLFTVNQFSGQDEIQGPYYLVGGNNELNILVLSGTEKVYLDGNLMIRGEQADYVIDYGIGTITFNNNRLITSDSRIIVDFEYTDKRYNRAIITGANTLNLFRNKLKFTASYVNQDDNQDKPIDFTLTENDREILANAGDDRRNAVKSGVVFVGADTSGIGFGLYAKADTVINKVNYSYFKYLPNDSTALYQVAFSFVGQGFGSYIQQSQLQYNFVGPNQGSFDTVVFIPVPNAHQVADLKLTYESSPKREFTFDLESALSIFDANKFSDLGDNNNEGVALYGTLGLNKYNFNLFGMRINTLEFKLKEKLVNRVFLPLERYNPVEFYREYDIQDTNKLTEDLHEATLRILPVENLDIRATFGQLLRGDVFNSLRTVGEIILTNSAKTIYPDIGYKFELTNSDYTVTNTSSSWIKQYARIGFKKFLSGDSYDDPNFEVSLDYKMENRENILTGSSGDSLEANSFSFNEIKPRLTMNNIFDMNIYTEFGLREDNFPINGVMLDQSNSFLQTYGLRYAGVNWLSTLFELTFRKKIYTEAFASEANVNNNTILVNWQTRLDPLNNGFLTDLYYNVTSERQAKIEKVFQQVRVGEGNYIYLGDLYGGGTSNENNFQLALFNDGDYIRLNIPTSQLFPVTTLNASARFNLKFGRILNISGSDFLSELLRNTTAETFLRTEEKTTDENSDNIYFLNFGSFQNDSNTLLGVQVFQQDINFFEFNPSYSLKLRYLQQNGFNQFVSGNERLYLIQKTVKLRLGLTKDVTTIFEYQNNTDRNTAVDNSIRNRDINSEGLLNDLSYRPVPAIESSFQVNFFRAIDNFPQLPVQADINQQVLSFIYSFTFTGRIRAEFERNEVTLSNSNATFPYELTNGKTEGINFLWRLFFDYSISQNLQATLNYDGRNEGGRGVIHSGRGEIKAFF
jgi:hypothetical protein